MLYTKMLRNKKVTWLGSQKKILLAIALSGGLMLLAVFLKAQWDSFQALPQAAGAGDHSAATQVMTKAAVDELVNRAAQEKYLRDVLTSQPLLPLPKHPIPLQPAHNNVAASTNKAAAQPNPPVVARPNVPNLAAQRCFYRGQGYVAGDIVKTPQGWLRCLPTVAFTANGDAPQAGNLVWTPVQ